MPATVDTSDNRKSKPETAKFYNSIKFGANVVDQMAIKYTVNQTSLRWAVQFFYNILDLAAINALILYKLVFGSKISRQKYFLQLSQEFRSKFVEQKQPNSHQSSHTNSSLQKGQKRKHCQSKNCTNKRHQTCNCSSKLVCGKCIGKQKNTFILKFVENKYCL